MMSESGSSVPPPVPPPGGPGKSGGSRESSEFEFVEGKQSTLGPPVPLPGALPPPPTTLEAATISTTPAASVAPPQTPPEIKTPQEPKQPPPKQPPTEKPQEQERQDEDEGPGLFSWMKGASGGILSKVAEKTKSSVETVITTLDPQMKEFIYSGGDVAIIVASDKEVKVNPVRDAFQQVFGRATVYGLPARPSKSVAEQPVGFAAGRQGAAERIQGLRGKATNVDDDDVVVAVEGFLLEVGEDSWTEISCLTLSDVKNKITVTCYSQPTPVDAVFVQRAKDATEDSYPKRWSGLAKTIGAVIAEEWSIPHNRWHEAATGVTRQEVILLAAKTLAGMYQRALANKVDDV